MAGPENLNDPIQVDVNNIYQETHGIITHIHSYERWYGAKAVPTATQFADATETAFQIDSGNLIYGDWVQILGSEDTPITAGKAYYDLHRLLIIATERTDPYRLQLAFGATGDAAVAAGEYTEVLYDVGLGTPSPGPLDVQGPRHAAGTLCWARCRVAQNTGTLSFFIGLHEYDT